MMAKRRPDYGIVNPYRPCPADFRDRYLEMGFSKELIEHYRTNWRVIRRWIEESGGEELRQARAAITGAPLRPDRRFSIAKLYVQGRRFRLGKNKGFPAGKPAPRFWDVALLPAPSGEPQRKPAPPKLSVERAARLAMTAIEPGSNDDFAAGVRAAVAAIQAVAEAKED